jgi:amyloid beta precursor protein binding protein 1
MGLESASSQETSSESAGLEAMEAAAANGAPASKRYDRQIRIWGAHGQHRLESCKVALLNCGPTGAEALKNLVLGGIAGFTIVDGARVSAADLGNNFMVDASSLGEPRAKIVTEFVKELNDSVAGSYVEEVPEALLETNPTFFSQFTVVIATQVGLIDGMDRKLS